MNEMRPFGMRLKIGVMGSASDEHAQQNLATAYRLGIAIAKADCVLVTGACQGLPLAAADGAQSAGGLVIGISPGLSLDEHVHKYGSPPIGHAVLIFTGSGLMGREVVNIRSSDIVVIVGGRSGTLGEFSIAYDEGKLIGVLSGTGGITDLLPQIVQVCAKDTGSQVLYESEPEALIKQLLDVYRREHFKHPSCFSRPQPEVLGRFRTSRDVVCGMWVEPGEGRPTRERNGTVFHFCCDACARQFEQSPLEYLTRSW